MTVNAETAKSGPYTGNGSTVVHAYAFKVLDQAHIVVTQTVTATGVETVKTLTTHYTVSGVGSDGGGNVTMVTAAESTDTITITRAVPQTQTTDLVNRAAVVPATVETAIDRGVQMVQDFDEEMTRAIKLPVSTDMASVSALLPAPAANGYLLWDTAGTALTTSTTAAGQLLGNDGTVSLPYYSYSADPDSGWLRVGANNIAASVGGTKVVDVTSTGINSTVIGATTPAAGTFSSITSGGAVLSDTDSTDSLGSTGVRWLKLWVDSIQTTANLDVAGDLVVTGNLTVSGSTTSIDSNTVNIGDNILVLNSDETGTPSQSAGFEIERGTSSNVQFVWDEGNDRWTVAGQALYGTGTLTFSGGGALTGTWSDLGTVSTVDINGGTVDGAAIGASSASTGAFTTIAASTSIALATGATITGIDNGDVATGSATLGVTQNAVKVYSDANAIAPGLPMTFEADTDAADKGNGRVWFNAAIASATLIYIDDNLNDGSTSIATLVGNLDDNTNSFATAMITIHEGGNGGATAFFKVTGAVTDLTTHSSVVVQYLGHSGTFSDGDVIGMQFSFSGTDGSAGDVFKGVVAKTTNFTVVGGNDDYVLTMDASGGSRTFTLTAAATLADGFVVTLKKIDSSANTVTIDANSSETIDGALTVVLTSQYETTTLICDGSNWHTVLASTPGGTVTVDNYADSTNYTSGSTTTLTLSVSPASENSITVTFDGVMQHHDTYSLSGAVVTFDTAIPTGTSDVEITTIASLDIGTPADDTVGYDQLAHIGTANQILTSNGSGSAPSYQDPAVDIGLVIALGA